MSVPPGTEMFQFPGFASYTYVFSARYLLLGGFPHSEISGSTIARISPKLIAACHVLHRLLAPRHPPSALNSLSPTTLAPTRRTISPSKEKPTQPRIRIPMQQALIDAQQFTTDEAGHTKDQPPTFTHQSRFTCQNSSPAPEQRPSQAPAPAGKQGFP